MTEEPERSVAAANRIVSKLRELISALDRRVPQVDRPGELRIARDAQMLRRQAVARIEALSCQEPDDKTYDPELVDAIMTDDGSPSRESETNMRSSEDEWEATPAFRVAATAGIPRLR